MLLAAVSLLEVRLHQFLDEVASLDVEVSGELELARQDLLINTKRVLIRERRIPGKYLEDQDTKRPPVISLTVAFGSNHLRRNVLRCTTDSIRLVFHDLSKTEICELHVPLRIDEAILWLQISINNMQSM